MYLFSLLNQYPLVFGWGMNRDKYHTYIELIQKNPNDITNNIGRLHGLIADVQRVVFLQKH